MKKQLIAFLSGLLFALGLGVSGMTQPAKVSSFLDIFGDWDPSLAFVMMGAIGVNAVLVTVILKRKYPVFGEKFALPTRRDLDGRLIAGAAVFGVRWALAGMCPGPGIVALASGSWMPLLFVGAMTAGMLLSRAVDTVRAQVKGPELPQLRS